MCLQMHLLVPPIVTNIHPNIPQLIPHNYGQVSSPWLPMDPDVLCPNIYLFILILIYLFLFAITQLLLLPCLWFKRIADSAKRSSKPADFTRIIVVLLPDASFSKLLMPALLVQLMTLVMRCRQILLPELAQEWKMNQRHLPTAEKEGCHEPTP